MILNYFGDGCFRLQSGDLSLLVDPTNNRLKADVTMRTLVSAEGRPAAGTEIAAPGEYEMKGIDIEGYAVPEESTEKFVKTVYAVNWEGMRFVFLGHLSKLPSGELIEELGEPDVLVLPAGGGHFLESTDAAKIVKQLEPAVAVPSFVKSAVEFGKALGQKVEPADKFVFKKKDIAEFKGRLVALEAKV